MSEKSADQFHMVLKVTPFPDGVGDREKADDEVEADGVVVILVKDGEGGASYHPLSQHGKTNARLPPHECWRAWFALAKHLAIQIREDDPVYGWMASVTAGMVQTVQYIQSKGELKRKTGLVGSDGKDLLV